MVEGTARELVAAFDSAEAVEKAVSELTSAGWDRAELSMLVQQNALDPEHVPAAPTEDPEAAHAAVVSDPDIRNTRTMAASMAGVVAAFVASEATIMTGGAVLAAIIGAAAAGGGAAAAVSALGWAADEKHDDFLRQQIEKGGIGLWVRVASPEQEARARDILTRNGGHGLRLHDIGEATATGAAPLRA